MCREKVLLVCVCLICVFISAAWAETVDLGPIVVTPSRVTEPAAGASANVTVISQKTIEKSGAVYIPDILAQAAGIDVYSQSSPKNKIVDIRGQGDSAVRNVLVLVNGRRVNPVDISGPDWLQLPISSIERIEVIRGAASVAYGDNANAGVVNIITKDGKDEPYVQVGSEFGSYDYQRHTAEAGGSKGPWSLFTQAAYSDLDGYRANSGLLTRDGQARVGYKVNDQAKLDLEAGWHDDNYRLPGGASATFLAQNGRRSSDTPNDLANSNDRFVRLSTELKPFESDGSAGTLFADYSYRDRKTFGFLDYGGGFTTATRRNTVTNAAGLRYVMTPQVLGHDLRLTTGADVSDSRNAILSTDGPDLTIRKEDAGVYLLSDYSLTEHLSANAGARYQKAYYTFDQHNVPLYETRDPSVTAYSGGLKYEYAPGSNVFVSVADSFRFLATDEWFSEWSGLNTALKHQEGVEYQVGDVHRLSDAFKVNATGFLTRNRNEIFVDPTLAGGLGGTSNYGRTERMGLELGADLNLREALQLRTVKTWNLYASGTIQSAEFQEGAFDGKDIPFVPREQFRLGTGIMLPNGLGLDVAGRYTGSQFRINDVNNDRPKVKPFLVADTRLRFARKSAEVYVGINNVFDKKYYDYVVFGQSSGNTDYYPAAERNYIAGVKYRF